MSKKPYYNMDNLLTMASNYGCLRILSALCGNKLGSALTTPARRNWCPNENHTKQKSGQAFRFFKDVDSTGGCVCNTCGKFSNIISTVMWINGWDAGEAIAEIANEVGLEPEESGTTPYSHKKAVQPKASKIDRQVSKYSDSEIEENKLKLRKLIDSSMSMRKQEARRIFGNYCINRGLNPEICIKKAKSNIWVHPKLDYFEMVVDDNNETRYQKVGSYPALLIVYFDKSKKPINIHRIYLNKDGHGKADLPKGYDGKPLVAKKSMVPAGDMAGGYMEISNIAGRIQSIAEGFETGLVPESVLNLPTRCSSAGMTKYISIEDDVSMVLHFCDPDQAGLNDAKALKKRCLDLGKEYVCLLPPVVKGIAEADWLDVLKHLGKEAVINSVNEQLARHKRYKKAAA